MQLVLLSAVLASALVLTSAGYIYEAPTGGYGRHQATRNHVQGDHEWSSQQQLDHHKHLFEEHSHHIKMITDFSCNGPQKRLVSVKDVIPVQDTYSKTFFPDVTVLHHCDHSCGSCPKGKVCAALQSSPITRVFQITFQDDIGIHKRGDTEYEQYQIPEHSLCHCADLHHH